MPTTVLDPWLRLHVELALSAHCACTRTLAQQDARARELGISGAEVDAARALGGFDVKAAAAVRYACALRAGDERETAKARQRAVGAGLTESDIRAVAMIASELVIDSTSRDQR